MNHLQEAYRADLKEWRIRIGLCVNWPDTYRCTCHVCLPTETIDIDCEVIDPKQLGTGNNEER